MNLDTGTKIVYIKINELSVEEAYQREFDEARARRMSQAFDLSRVGTLVVARRQDGARVIVDGQTRAGAAKFAGYGECAIRCEVHEGLTLQEEAELFRKLNKGRKAVGALDDYRAALVAKDPVAVEIDLIVTSLGLRIASGPAARNIQAIGAVSSVHVRQNNLHRTLGVLAAWDDASAFNGSLIRALSFFFSHYDNLEGAPVVESAHLIKQIRLSAPEHVCATIKRRTSGRVMTLREAGILTFQIVYNKRLSPKRRLPTYLHY